MLGEDNLRETDLRQSVSNINYDDFNHRNRNCNCRTHVKPLLCYCFGIAVYLGSCAFSFYAGHVYEID